MGKHESVLTLSEQAIVFAIARSECEKDFVYYRNKLAETNPDAAKFRDGIKKEQWVTYAFQDAHASPTYGEVTSNLSEAANNWIGDTCRSSMPLHAFEQYMINIVVLFAERRSDSTRETRKQGERASTPRSIVRGNYDPLVPAYQDRLDELAQFSKACDIMPCMDSVYMVRVITPSS